MMGKGGQKWLCTECGESRAFYGWESAKAHARDEHGSAYGHEAEWMETPEQRIKRLESERAEAARLETAKADIVNWECDQNRKELASVGWDDDSFGVDDFLFHCRGGMSA